MIIKCGISTDVAQSGKPYKSFRLSTPREGSDKLPAAMDKLLEAEYGDSTVYIRSYSFVAVSIHRVSLLVRATN